MNTRLLAPLFAAALLVSAPAATAAAAPSLTEANKAAIAKDFEPFIKGLWAAALKLDVDGALSFFADIQDFRYATQDGKTYTRGEVKKVAEEMWGGFSHQTVVFRKEKSLVLAKDLVLYTWEGSNDMIQKDGAIFRSDPAAGSYLFRKIGSTWKCIHMHESGPDFKPVKP